MKSSAQFISSSAPTSKTDNKKIKPNGLPPQLAAAWFSLD
jgi:hypothetical protein